MKVYIDGELHEKADAKISVYDHGVLYGDGIFEGIRAYNGRVFRLDDHLQRLNESANAILLRLPMSIKEIAADVKSRGWMANLDDPRNALAAAANRLVGEGEVEKVNPNVYRYRIDRLPPVFDTTGEEMIPDESATGEGSG